MRTDSSRPRLHIVRPSQNIDLILKSGDLKKIEKALSEGMDIDSVDAAGKTALWWAAFNGNPELVAFLIRHNANPNIPDKFGKTPLDIAFELASRGYREPGEDNIHARIMRILRSTSPEPNPENRLMLGLSYPHRYRSGIRGQIPAGVYPRAYGDRNNSAGTRCCFWAVAGVLAATAVLASCSLFRPN